MQHCSQCGAELPPDSPGGHCLNCLLQIGLAAGAPTHLPTQPGGGAPDKAFASEAPGERVGRYKLLRKIGEGGMGVVYMAEQREPVIRKVALKVIKLGMDTRQVVARFEAERQALALMDHPNIAKVLDAGSTESGRPYFVMDLVEGLPITRFCEEGRLSIRERLGLFIQVCSAIQHAHQKGIIHRDIKPSNVLLTRHGDEPVPKVIDFGIAKATQGRLTDQTVLTALGQFVGTPAYMSPEQLDTSSLDIDTRSDIYSLGVLLYELLTSKTPFDTQELRAAGVQEIRRLIQEKEPARPSTRVATDLSVTGAGLPTLESAANSRRLLRGKELIRELRGDLDWIAMKCLEKDRSRRYETATELAGDIERHLKNEPVLAGPPSKLYRFQKLVRRNKLAFAASTVVALSLVLGFGFSTWQYVGKSRAYRKVVLAERESDAARRRLAETVDNLEIQRAEDHFTAGDSSTPPTGFSLPYPNAASRCPNSSSTTRNTSIAPN
jgi:serine/threonine protein kinase